MSLTVIETRKLSLHPLAIHTFIKAQAGSLGKAFSEAVMNSIDAFANNVKITLSPEGFTILDDGQGFQTKEEISAWFETLGFPHDEGNHRLYGKFGMGRAQMWAFASTIWYSNSFEMYVDVQKKGLDYELSMGNSAFNGTKIVGRFYEPLSFADLERVKLEITALARFAPKPVYVNGAQISKNPKDENWTLDTPLAWYRFDTAKEAHSLAVYNAGILVANFPAYRFGIRGVVVTKPDVTLSLNLARNDVLESSCKVWKEIVKSFPKEKPTESRKSVERLSKEDLNVLIDQLHAGEVPLAEVLTKAPELLTSVHGRKVPLNHLVSAYRNVTVIFSVKNDEFGKRLNKLRLAEVLDLEVLTRFKCSTVEAFKELVLKHVSTEKRYTYDSEHASVTKSTWSATPAIVFPDIAAGKLVYAPSELSKEDKPTYKAWYRSSVILARNFHQARPGLKLRIEPELGDSPTEEAWYSRDTHQFVLRKKEATAAMQQPLPSLTVYVLKVTRTLCQQISETDLQGDSLFLDLTTKTPYLGQLILGLVRQYVYEAGLAGLVVPKTRLDELDRLNVE